MFIEVSESKHTLTILIWHSVIRKQLILKLTRQMSRYRDTRDHFLKTSVKIRDIFFFWLSLNSIISNNRLIQCSPYKCATVRDNPYVQYANSERCDMELDVKLPQQQQQQQTLLQIDYDVKVAVEGDSENKIPL